MATIDAEVSTSHEGRGIRDEEDGSATELGGIRDATEHVLASPLGLTLRVDIEEVLKHLGLNVTGREGVDTDTVLAPFRGEGATKLKDGRLGGIVDTEDGLAKKSMSQCGKLDTHGANIPRLAMVPDMEAIMQMLPGVLRRTI